MERMDASMDCKIFISHSYKNTCSYKKLLKLLKQSKSINYINYSLPKPSYIITKNQFDQKQIEQRIINKIEASDFIFVIIHKSIIGRPWIEFEVRESQKRNKMILGIQDEKGGFCQNYILNHVDAVVDWDIDLIDCFVSGVKN